MAGFDPVTKKVEGLEIFIARREKENAVDIEFINPPVGFPSGYTIGLTSSSSDPSLETLLEDVKETIRSYRAEMA